MPLIRRDDAPKRADAQLDRDNMMDVFREATWEEALDRAAAGLKKILDRDGGQALAGFGSAKGSNEEAYLFQKLIRQGFGTNNVDHCTRLCHASSVAALMEGLNSGAVTAPFTAAEDADCIIVIGASPTENHPVAATYLKQAAKRGAELIVMDPRGQNAGLGRHATRVLQFKPGTRRGAPERHAPHHHRGAALRPAICPGEHRGLRGAEGPHRRLPAGGDGEGLRHPRRDHPRGRAHSMPARAPRSSSGAWASRSTIHGTDNARCLIALALITGQVGRPGTGLHPLRGQNNVQGASDAGLIPMVFPDYKSVEDPEIRGIYEAFWGASSTRSAG